MPDSTPQIRRRNLLLLLNDFTSSLVSDGQRVGMATAFSAKIGIHKSLLTRLKGEGSTARDMSDSLARQIEHALSLPCGWMDIPREDAPMTSAEQSLTDLALRASRATDAQGRRSLRKLLQEMIEKSDKPQEAQQTR